MSLCGLELCTVLAPRSLGGVEEVLSRTADTFHRLGIKLLGYDILFLLTGAYDPREERAVAYY